MSNIQDTLNQRAKTHGDFRKNGRIMQNFKAVAREGINWGSLESEQKEAIEMILHKLGRILCGDPREPDHWKDIAGYATLIENILTKGESSLPSHVPISQEELGRVHLGAIYDDIVSARLNNKFLQTP